MGELIRSSASELGINVPQQALEVWYQKIDGKRQMSVAVSKHAPLAIQPINDRRVEDPNVELFLGEISRTKKTKNPSQNLAIDRQQLISAIESGLNTLDVVDSLTGSTIVTEQHLSQQRKQVWRNNRGVGRPEEINFLRSAERYRKNTEYILQRTQEQLKKRIEKAKRLLNSLPQEPVPSTMGRIVKGMGVVGTIGGSLMPAFAQSDRSVISSIQETNFHTPDKSRYSITMQPSRTIQFNWEDFDYLNSLSSLPEHYSVDDVTVNVPTTPVSETEKNSFLEVISQIPAFSNKSTFMLDIPVVNGELQLPFTTDSLISQRIAATSESNVQLPNTNNQKIELNNIKSVEDFIDNVDGSVLSLLVNKQGNEISTSPIIRLTHDTAISVIIDGEIRNVTFGQDTLIYIDGENGFFRYIESDSERKTIPQAKIVDSAIQALLANKGIQVNEGEVILVSIEKSTGNIHYVAIEDQAILITELQQFASYESTQIPASYQGVNVRDLVTTDRIGAADRYKLIRNYNYNFSSFGELATKFVWNEENFTWEFQPSQHVDGTVEGVPFVLAENNNGVGMIYKGVLLPDVFALPGTPSSRQQFEVLPTATFEPQRVPEPPTSNSDQSVTPPVTAETGEDDPQPTPTVTISASELFFRPLPPYMDMNKILPPEARNYGHTREPLVTVDGIQIQPGPLGVLDIEHNSQTTRYGVFVGYLNCDRDAQLPVSNVLPCSFTVPLPNNDVNSFVFNIYGGDMQKTQRTFSVENGIQLRDLGQTPRDNNYLSFQYAMSMKDLYRYIKEYGNGPAVLAFRMSDDDTSVSDVLANRPFSDSDGNGNHYQTFFDIALIGLFNDTPPRPNMQKLDKFGYIINQ